MWKKLSYNNKIITSSNEIKNKQKRQRSQNFISISMKNWNWLIETEIQQTITTDCNVAEEGNIIRASWWVAHSIDTSHSTTDPILLYDCSAIFGHTGKCRARQAHVCIVPAKFHTNRKRMLLHFNGGGELAGCTFRMQRPKQPIGRTD